MPRKSKNNPPIVGASRIDKGFKTVIPSVFRRRAKIVEAVKNPENWRVEGDQIIIRLPSPAPANTLAAP